MQFLKDWILALVVLIMVIFDFLVLTVFTAIVIGGNVTIVQSVPNKENPRTVEGVKIILFSY